MIYTGHVWIQKMFAAITWSELTNFRVTESGEGRITESGDYRITDA